MVNDFDKYFTFYKDTLDLECTWGKLGENYASFNADYSSIITLFSADQMNVTINNVELNLNEKNQDKFAIIIEVENVDEAYKNLNNKGLSFLTAPKDMIEWGIRVTHFRDPENNLIEFYQDLPREN